MVKNPFDSIESAHEYLQLLDKMLEDVQETSADDFADSGLLSAPAGPRRDEALRLVTYKLDQLRHHVTASSRILNDLRTIRRLLLGERKLTTHV